MKKYRLVSSNVCKDLISKHPDFKIFWRSGFAFKGAKEVEDDKQPKEQFVYQEGRSRVLTFEERMQRRYNWAAAIDIDFDEDAKEIHINGYSVNDMM